MTLTEIRHREAEQREAYDRMAGLVVAIICAFASFSAGLLAWAML